MSALHRVDDMWSMASDRFFRLAKRLPSYAGAVAAALREYHAGLGNTTPDAPTPRAGQSGAPARAAEPDWLPEDAPGARDYTARRARGEDIVYVAPTAAAMSLTPFAGLFSCGTG